MSEQRPWLRVAALFAVVALVAAACGAQTTPAPSGTPTTAPTATEGPSQEPFTGDAWNAGCDNYPEATPGELDYVKAVDRYTVEFGLCYPDVAFLSKIAFSPFAIYPKEWIESTVGDTTRTSEGLEAPVGTGPYMVSEWTRGESLTFTANPDYWGEAPQAETLVLRWSTESAARLTELQAGTIDGFDNVAPEDFETIEGDSNLHLQIREALNTFYIGMTNTFPPFDNQQVRQAIAMGIDRQRIVDNFYPAGSEVASHFTPCAIPNACEGQPWYDFDVEAPKALLAEAGFPDGFETKLYYRDVVRGYLPQVANVAQDIQAQLLENLNINAEIVVMESGAFI